MALSAGTEHNIYYLLYKSPGNAVSTRKATTLDCGAGSPKRKRASRGNKMLASQKSAKVQQGQANKGHHWVSLSLRVLKSYPCRHSLNK